MKKWGTYTRLRQRKNGTHPKGRGRRIRTRGRPSFTVGGPGLADLVFVVSGSIHVYTDIDAGDTGAAGAVPGGAPAEKSAHLNRRQKYAARLLVGRGSPCCLALAAHLLQLFPCTSSVGSAHTVGTARLLSTSPHCFAQVPHVASAGELLKCIQGAQQILQCLLGPGHSSEQAGCFTAR